MRTFETYSSNKLKYMFTSPCNSSSQAKVLSVLFPILVLAYDMVFVECKCADCSSSTRSFFAPGKDNWKTQLSQWVSVEISVFKNCWLPWLGLRVEGNPEGWAQDLTHATQALCHSVTHPWLSFYFLTLRQTLSCPGQPWTHFIDQADPPAWPSWIAGISGLCHLAQPRSFYKCFW